MASVTAAATLALIMDSRASNHETLMASFECVYYEEATDHGRNLTRALRQSWSRLRQQIRIGRRGLLAFLG